jgi:hypothetical protein
LISLSPLAHNFGSVQEGWLDAVNGVTGVELGNQVTGVDLNPDKTARQDQRLPK